MTRKSAPARKHLAPTDPRRRKFLEVSGLAAIGSLFSRLATASAESRHAKVATTLRWGFVGTGSIAAGMATMIRHAAGAELAAVSSRKMETAREFADQHGVPAAFDSWAEMLASDAVDAIYVATPTSVREEIAIAAANAGKHVLAEKPFASLPSLRRITAACRRNDVAFMDGTHFVHHPRTHDIRQKMQQRVGWPWSVDSAFQFNLPDRGNIRFNPELEPLGAIGDAGWYNMRAAVEYLAPDVSIRSVSAYLRRDVETGAAISGSGAILFDDGSTTTWNCGFDSGAVIMDLRISGGKGVIRLNDFLGSGQDGVAVFTHHRGGFGPGASAETISIPSQKPGPVLMFEDFAAAVSDRSLREPGIAASERTQLLLDAIWNAALEHEKSG